MKTAIVVSIAATATLIASPLSAGEPHIYVDRDRGLPIAPNNDSNPWWLDYKTDISEAKRELASDLRRATDEEDRLDAHEEYRREILDARYDYRKEMRERGYRVANFRENRRRVAFR